MVYEVTSPSKTRRSVVVSWPIYGIIVLSALFLHMNYKADVHMKKQKLSGHVLIGASCRRSAVVSKHYTRWHIKKSEATHKNHHYQPWSLIGLCNHLHGNYSQCFFVHRHLNSAWYNKTHFLIGKSYLAIIASKNWGNPKRQTILTFSIVNVCL